MKKKEPPKEISASTPLMRQYQQIKSKYPETVLLFRLGDFYETFEEDAKITSSVLGITLTRRGSGTAGEVPLAGFPYHALESYLPKLLKAGYRVAICEQLEDPKFAKGIVKRDVVEIVTPGIAFTENVLEKKQNNYLAAIALPSAIAAGDDVVGLAFADISTGEFNSAEVLFKDLIDQLMSVLPSEIIVQKRDCDTLRSVLNKSVNCLITKIDDWIFNYDYAHELLITQFKTQTLKGFGVEEQRVGIIAAGAVMNYLQETQKANLSHLRRIAPYDVGGSMTLDASTKRNLEITTSIFGFTNRNGAAEGTLFSVLDNTSTPMGGRMLKRWVNQPLRDCSAINERLDAVAALVKDENARKSISAELKHIGDIERLIARIATGRANPREVNYLKVSLSRVPRLSQLIEPIKSNAIEQIFKRLDPLADLTERISSALNDNPPLALSDGGVFRKGYSSELDELRAFAFEGKDWIAKLQQEERQRAGISSLKVGYNNVFGYYIEITNTHKEKVPSNYIRKQTLANAERFVTPELKEYEEKILNAEERILTLEKKLFEELRQFAAEHSAAIQQNARMIAALDCFTGLADCAVSNNYVRPVVDDSTATEIKDGRHPVLERLLPPGERYTPNDTYIDTDTNQVHVITGPNMSGKSSYLRQVGLIVLLAQIGSFVPASSARIGIVDKVFTRVGASDNITAGESTFLVEMHEAAQIVNTATKKSLILLDEVGRGTSTFDGISIAWALTEYLHERIGARTLFATHYHELNELAELYPRIVNYKVDVREYGDKVIFLHKVLPGFADHSYGIQVAQMAGLPEEVTERAKQILKNLEASELTLLGELEEQSDSDSKEKTKTRSRTLGLSASKFPEVQMTLFEMKADIIAKELENIDLETLTPIQALNLLSELKLKASEKNNKDA